MNGLFKKFGQGIIGVLIVLMVTASIQYLSDYLNRPQRLDCEDVDAIEYIFNPFGNQFYTGYVKLCDSLGKVTALYHYNNVGELDGRCESYFENGDVSEVQGYKNGTIQYDKTYTANGILWTEFIYKDGKHFCVKEFDIDSGKRIKPSSDWKECDGSCKDFVINYEFQEYEFHDEDGKLIE